MANGTGRASDCVEASLRLKRSRGPVRPTVVKFGAVANAALSSLGLTIWRLGNVLSISRLTNNIGEFKALASTATWVQSCERILLAIRLTALATSADAGE